MSLASSLRPRSIASFLQGLKVSFQRQAAGNLNATYHFTFTGTEQREASVTINSGKIAVQDGLIGQPSIHITADTVTWLAFLAKETTLLWALLTRRIRMRGNPKWLLAFSRCFPS